MSDETISQQEGSWVFYIGLLVSLCTVSAWYLTQGRDGAVDAWKGAALAFVAWLIWEYREKFYALGESNPNTGIISIEHAVIGKQRNYWHDEKTGIRITWLVTIVCLFYSGYHFFDSQYLAIREGSTDMESLIYGAISSLMFLIPAHG